MVMQRTYPRAPSLPAPTWVTNWRVSVIVPIARLNLITNPSIETATTGYTAVGGSIAQSAAQSFHGTYSLAITPTAATTDGAYYTTSTLVANTTYGVSVKFLGVAGRKYRFAVETTGAAILTFKDFVATGKWQWITLIHNETSSSARRIYMVKNGGTDTGVFYIDGLQLEACETGNYFCTTYIDGDQKGLLGAREVAPYYWNGTPHASTSGRTGQTRAGGSVKALTTYGLLITAIIGLGLTPVDIQAQPYVVLDGSQWISGRKTDRSLAINARWGAMTPERRDENYANLATLFDLEYIATRQPLTLAFEPMDRYDKPTQAPILVPYATYSSGLEGLQDNLPVGDTPITFTQNLPLVIARDAGATLAVQTTVTANGLLEKNITTNQWGALGSGMTGTAVEKLIYGPDGKLYAGGSYTDMGGSGADNIAVWDGSSWAVLASATALNNQVVDMAFDANGVLYVGGNFTNANGNANADGIATWNGSAWGALSTGANGNVYAVEFAPNGTLYVGGTFTTIGGVAANRIASWNGSAFSAMGSGATGGDVLAIVVLPNGNIVIGGTFTSVGGVGTTDDIALWDGSTWNSLGGATGGSVFALAVGPDGTLYAGGSFTAIGGVSAINVAQWNGVAWSPLGGGISSSSTSVQNITVSPDGTVYAMGTWGAIPTADGFVLPDSIAQWNGTTWVPLDIDTPWSTIYTMAFKGDNTTVALGGNATGSATTASNTTVNHPGTNVAYPIITINGPSSGTARIYSIRNLTTGANLWLNLTLNVGEVATLNTDPTNFTFTSTFQGNILSKIMPGSNSPGFSLQRGDNVIALFSASTTVTARLRWPVTFNTLPGAIQ